MAEKNLYNKNLNSIKGKEIVYPRQIDWKPLVDAGLAGNLKHKLTTTIHCRWTDNAYDINDWERLFEIKQPIYKELCLEFCATVSLLTISRITDPLLMFRLGGAPRQMSLEDMAVCLNIFTPEEMGSSWFKDYLYRGARFKEGEVKMEEMWSKLSKEPYSSGDNYATNLTQTRWKLFQKFIAHSIDCRGKNTEKVNEQDMWFLTRIEKCDTVSIPYCVAYILSKYSRGRKLPSKIAGGHYITLIAKHLDIPLKPKDHPYTLVPDTSKLISIEMYTAAQAVSQVKGRYVPYQPPKSKKTAPSSSHSHATPMDTDPPVSASGAGSSSQTQIPDAPVWLAGLESRLGSQFDSLRLQEENHYQENRYNWGIQMYHDDWVGHNVRRLFGSDTHLGPTIYHRAPQWGEPGAVFPTPVYDETVAMAELGVTQDSDGDDDGDSQRAPDVPPQVPPVHEGWRSWPPEVLQQQFRGGSFEHQQSGDGSYQEEEFSGGPTSQHDDGGHWLFGN